MYATLQVGYRQQLKEDELRGYRSRKHIGDVIYDFVAFFSAVHSFQESKKGM